MGVIQFSIILVGYMCFWCLLEALDIVKKQ